MIDPPTVRIESPALPSAAVQIHELEGVESLGKLFEFRIELVCIEPEGLDEESVLSEPASLVFYRDGQEMRRIFGVISAVKGRLHSESDHLAYTLHFAPRAYCLSLNRMSRVFVDMSIPDILEQKLTDAGFVARRDFDLRLIAKYPKRELVIQYEETDLQFVSRLAEHLGISIFTEHNDDRDVLVLSDDNSAFKPIDGEPTVSFYRRGEAIGVFALEGTTRTIPGKYVMKDYNYRTPQVDLVAETSVSETGKGSVVEYGAHFKTKEEGDHMAKVRAEELRGMRRVFDGKSDIQALRAGAKFKLEGHPKCDEELLVIEVRHRASQVVFGMGEGNERTYTNEFRAIPATTTFRPSRVTQKPKVHGAISGVVEAAAEGGKYAELDEQGRYHVRLMMDQGSAPKGNASSLLRMAQPHAGPGYGFHFPLREGVEVMLTCIDGDPDRPIITGAVPNPATPSTVGGKNAKRNVIRTGGGTELNIDDEETGTRFKISTPCQNTVFQLGAPNAPVLGIFMGTDKDAVMKAGETIGILAAEKIDVTAGINLNESAPWIDIAGGSKINAHAPEVEVHGGAKVTVDGPTIDVVASGNLNEKAPTIDVQGGSTVRVGAPEIEVNGSSVIGLNAGALLSAGAQAVVVISAGAFVTVTAPDVTIEGKGVVVVKAPTVNIDGSGVVNVKGGTIKLN